MYNCIIFISGAKRRFVMFTCSEKIVYWWKLKILKKDNLKMTVTTNQVIVLSVYYVKVKIIICY